MADKIVANSLFTKGVFQTAFPSLQLRDMEVLYPGIQMSAYNQPFSMDDPAIRAIVR